MAPQGFSDRVALVWKVADKLRGTFKQHEYGSVMLPLLVLRRMDAVLAPTKDTVLDRAVATGALQSDRKISRSRVMTKELTPCVRSWRFLGRCLIRTRPI